MFIINEEEDEEKLLKGYIDMKKEFVKFKGIIPSMNNFFNNIELDSYKFNIKLK